MQGPTDAVATAHALGSWADFAKLPGGRFLVVALLAVIAGQQAWGLHDNDADRWLAGRMDAQESKADTLAAEVKAIGARMDAQEAVSAEIRVELKTSRKVQQGTLAAIRTHVEWEAEALEAGFAGRKIPKHPDAGNVYVLEGMLAE